MRVATVFTGVAAATVAFAPSALANTRVPQPYRMTAYIGSDVSSVQVCAYKSPSPGDWTCTSIRTPTYHHSAHGARVAGSTSFGGNWRDGQVKVWIWGTSADGTKQKEEYTCNTNGVYYGHFKADGGVSLTASPIAGKSTSIYFIGGNGLVGSC